MLPAVAGDEPPSTSGGGGRTTPRVPPSGCPRPSRRGGENVTEALPVGASPQPAGPSQFHFRRAFRASTGIPPDRWRPTRMARTQGLLVSRSSPRVQIALITGSAWSSQGSADTLGTPGKGGPEATPRSAALPPNTTHTDQASRARSEPPTPSLSLGRMFSHSTGSQPGLAGPTSGMRSDSNGVE